MFWQMLQTELAAAREQHDEALNERDAQLVKLEAVHAAALVELHDKQSVLHSDLEAAKSDARTAQAVHMRTLNDARCSHADEQEQASKRLAVSIAETNRLEADVVQVPIPSPSNGNIVAVEPRVG